MGFSSFYPTGGGGRGGLTTRSHGEQPCRASGGSLTGFRSRAGGGSTGVYREVVGWGSRFLKIQKGKVASQVFYVPIAGDVEHSGPEPGPRYNTIPGQQMSVCRRVSLSNAPVSTTHIFDLSWSSSHYRPPVVSPVLKGDASVTQAILPSSFYFV